MHKKVYHNNKKIRVIFNLHITSEEYLMKIFITRNIPLAGIDLLKKHHTLEIYPYNQPPSKQEILQGIKNKDGLLCLLSDPIDKEVITAEPKLKMIANYAVGYDNIDIQAATKHRIPVSNTPGVLTDATAEMAWALVFAVSRRIVEADTFTRAGKFNGWGPMLMLGQGITGKTLGVIGTGRIGTAFALKSKGFKMNVLYHSIHHNTQLEQQLHAQKVELNILLKKADIISVHVPLTKDTHHLIGEHELSLMKPHAILINTSRGPVIDEHALIKTLQNNKIFGAGLDVYEHEPDIPKELTQLNTVVLQPHAASATSEARTHMALIAAENMLIGLQGKKPPHCVNPEVFTTDKN